MSAESNSSTCGDFLPIKNLKRSNTIPSLIPPHPVKNNSVEHKLNFDDNIFDFEEDSSLDHFEADLSSESGYNSMLENNTNSASCAHLPSHLNVRSQQPSRPNSATSAMATLATETPNLIKTEHLRVFLQLRQRSLLSRMSSFEL